jgi:5-methylcytosine-specific restriction protein A
VKTLKPSIATLGASSTASGWKPDTQRGSRHKRNYGWAWEQLREQVLQRDSGICQPGLKRGEVHIANEVDHITSRAEARTLGWTTEQTEAMENLQSICTDCHRIKTSSEAGRGA